MEPYSKEVRCDLAATLRFRSHFPLFAATIAVVSTPVCTKKYAQRETALLSSGFVRPVFHLRA